MRVIPSLSRLQKKEDRQDAAIIFIHAMKSEGVHAVLYKKALEAVKAGKDFDEKIIYLCPVCGNIVIDTTPENCPICGVPGESFKVVE